MGLAFKPNIDDLRESPAMEITCEVSDAVPSEYLMVVEPNIESHPKFTLTNYKEAYDKADIVVFLVKHKEFASLNYRNDDIRILDFCGVFKL